MILFVPVPFSRHFVSRHFSLFSFHHFAPLVLEFIAASILYCDPVFPFLPLDAMSSWPSARSRSRTTSPTRHHGAGGSSRFSTTTHRSSQETTSRPGEVPSLRPSRRPPPDRHVLAIIRTWQTYLLASTSPRQCGLPGC